MSTARPDIAKDPPGTPILQRVGREQHCTGQNCTGQNKHCLRRLQGGTPQFFCWLLNPSQIIYTIYLHNSTYISTIDPVAVKISLSNLWGTALYFHCTCYANIPSGSSSLLWSHWHGCQNWKKKCFKGKDARDAPQGSYQQKWQTSWKIGFNLQHPSTYGKFCQKPATNNPKLWKPSD